MDFHVSSLRILYNQERKRPGKGCCHNLPSPSDLKQLETPPTRGGRAQRRTRTIMSLFYTAFQHCFTGVKKNPSATATASSRMWRGYRCFHYLCIPQNTGKFLHHLPRQNQQLEEQERSKSFPLPPLLSPQKFALPHTTGGVQHFSSFFLSGANDKTEKACQATPQNHYSLQKGNRSSL